VAQDAPAGIELLHRDRPATSADGASSTYSVLRSAAARFQSVLEAVPDAVVGVDSAGCIRFANAEAEQLLGYAAGQLAGTPIEQLVPERYRAAHPLRRAAYHSSSHTRPLGAGLELWACRRDGSEIPVDISLASLRGSSSGIVVAVIRDMTEKLAADQRLARLSAIVEFADDAIIGQTLDGIVETWNPAAERLYGYTAAEAVGMPVSVLVPPGHVNDVTEILDRVRRGEPVSQYDTMRMGKGGRVVSVMVSASPIFDARGVLLGATTIARDMTEGKRAEAAIRKLNVRLQRRVAERTSELTDAVEELESFSYSVAHDLRAPLRAIDGFSQILLEEYDGVIDDEGRRLIGVIRQATRDMGGLIDDLLAFSRIGRQPLQSVEIDMAQLMQSVGRDLRAQHAEREVAIDVGGLPPARGDATLVRQVVVNLLSNAVKFTAPRDHARIEVGGERDGDDCRYWVRDNGVGFDETYADKLFQVFQRLHPTDFEGTGVGLAIVHRVVTRHGGRVWADGSVGKGATFWFTLPASTRPESGAVPAAGDGA
jgi:PAS domain S-box-containing protein